MPSIFADTLKEVDSRITLGIGVGVQFIDNSIENLASDIGISAVKEDIGGDSDIEPALRLGVDYQRFVLAKTIELFHRQSILQLLGDEKNQVFSLQPVFVTLQRTHRHQFPYRLGLRKRSAAG